MKILMLNHNLRERGTWHRAWQLARELVRRGHAVTLWTAAPHHYYRPAHSVEDGVRIVETPSWAPLAGGDDGWGPLDLLYRSARLLAEPFDLCYAFAHPPNVALPAWLARRLRGRPLLWDWCDWYAGGIFPKRQALRRQGLCGAGEPPLQRQAERWEVTLERRMARLAGRLTVISNFLLEEALHLGRRADEVMLLPNGADLEGIRPLPRERCRAELGLPPGGQILGYVANYHPDQELLLRALAGACRELPELRLLKTGPPFAEPLVRELGLAGNIIDLGRVAPGQIPLVLGAADALALPLENNPSNLARIPFKWTDYLAAGRPVATCRVGDLARWFQSGAAETPGVASAPEAEAYAGAIRQLFAPAADREALGAAARRLAEREFSWTALTGRLEQFIVEWQTVDWQ
jgi:glycosyltransferase involved in cell wall biosynthesis